VRLAWAVAVRAYRRYATYRWATAAGVFTNTIFGFMRAYVLVALLRTRHLVGGFDTRDALTYTFITQGMIMTVGIFGWWEVAARVRTGEVVTDLSRPFDFQSYWFAQWCGRSVYQFVFRGLPPFIAGALAFRLRAPADPWLFAASVALAVCVSFGISFVWNLASFWLLDDRGVMALLLAPWGLLSGFVIPITFYPAGLLRVARALPFAATLETPVEVYLGKQHGLAPLAGQVMWVVVLAALGRLVLARAVRRLVVQGG
jgi:ABC-2 type transport system permease protein